MSGLGGSLFSGPMPSATAASLLSTATSSLSSAAGDASPPISSRSLFQPPPTPPDQLSPSVAASESAASSDAPRAALLDDMFRGGSGSESQFARRSSSSSLQPSPLQSSASPSSFGAVGARRPPRTPTLPTATADSASLVRGSHSAQNLVHMPHAHAHSLASPHSFNNLPSLQKQLQQQQQEQLHTHAEHAASASAAAELSPTQLQALVDSLRSLDLSHLQARTASHADLLAALAGAQGVRAPPSVSVDGGGHAYAADARTFGGSGDAALPPRLSSAFSSPPSMYPSQLHLHASPHSPYMSASPQLPPQPPPQQLSRSMRRTSSLPAMAGNVASVRCPNAHAGCAWLGASVSHAAAHAADECALTVIACRYAKFGCAVRCAKIEMHAHVEHAVGAHLQLCEAHADALTALLSSPAPLPATAPLPSLSASSSAATLSGSVEAGTSHASSSLLVAHSLGGRHSHSHTGLQHMTASSSSSLSFNAHAPHLQSSAPAASVYHSSNQNTNTSNSPFAGESRRLKSRSPYAVHEGGGSNAFVAMHHPQHLPHHHVPSQQSASPHDAGGDQELVLLLTRILFEHGKASVGKLGSLLHSYTQNHSLSTVLKEKFGGLKKFLELHAHIFSIGTDHPFNPTVWLSQQLQPQLLHLLHAQQHKHRAPPAPARPESPAPPPLLQPLPVALSPLLKPSSLSSSVPADAAGAADCDADNASVAATSTAAAVLE